MGIVLCAIVLLATIEPVSAKSREKVYSGKTPRQYSLGYLEKGSKVSVTVLKIEKAGNIRIELFDMQTGNSITGSGSPNVGEGDTRTFNIFEGSKYQLKVSQRTRGNIETGYKIKVVIDKPK